MSKNTKKKVDNVIKPRTRKTTQRKKGAKKINLAASAELFKQEFYIYWPDYTLDLSEYEDEQGNIDIESIPEDHLIELTCRYLDPGTFQEVLGTPFAVDTPDDDDLTEEEKKEKLAEMYKEKMENPKGQLELEAEIVRACCIDPKFESAEQVLSVFPTALIIEVAGEITRGATGKNLVSRF